MKFLDNVGDPLDFPATLPNCLCHVLFRRYSPLSVEVVEKLNKCTSYWVPFFSGGMTQTVIQQIVSVIYHLPFGKVWLSFVCLSPSAKPGNDIESRICIGCVKMVVQFETVCGPKFRTFCDDVGDCL